MIYTNYEVAPYVMY